VCWAVGQTDGVLKMSDPFEVTNATALSLLNQIVNPFVFGM
jgi:hypothetical protein